MSERQTNIFDYLPKPKPMAKASLPYQAHSDTSREAAESSLPHANTQRRRIYDALLERGPMTDEELQDALEMNPSTERPRRIELVTLRLVAQVGLGKTRSGRSAVKWGIATPRHY